MSDNFKIVIPSYKRPDRVLSASYLPAAYVCIGEDEKDAYAAHIDPERLICMPVGVQGNIARVRNWVLDNVGGNIVFMDDDVKALCRTEERSQRKLDKDEAMAFFEEGFICAEDMGVYLWGMNVTSDKLLYCEYTPLSTQAPILATVCCIRENPLRYDESIPLKEDYDYFLQHLRKYRKTFRYNMYHYICEHLTNNGGGGCISYRTLEKEKECAERLVRKWGTKIVRVDWDRSINPIIKPPLKGV